jgi:hypothetical protein
MNRFRQWILNRQFVKYRMVESKMSGIALAQRQIATLEKKHVSDIEEVRKTAFKYARADLEEMMEEKSEDKIEAEVMRRLDSLLSVVDSSKVVTVDKAKKVVYIGGELATAVKLSSLKAEADFMRQSELWQVLYETPKELAQRSMFVQGETLADMQKGKSMLYVLSNQKNIIDTFASYEGK